jgi:hypothetical protein
MPANLTPEYYAAEEEYRSARSREEKIRALEKMISVMPKHKGAEKIMGELRRKISLLRKEIVSEAKKKKGAAKKGIKKEGAAQVCLVGAANTGKSFIMNRLCNKSLKSTLLPFETTQPEVGMADIQGVQVQLIEIPSLHSGFYEKRGELRGILYTCDLICVLANKEDELDLARKEVETRGKKIIFANSRDLEGLRQKIWSQLDLIRVYTKEPGKQPEKRPVALKRGSTITDLGNAIHKDFVKRFKYAKVLRPKDKIKEIRAGLSFQLKDNDIVEFKTA